MGSTSQRDVFISYASEDRESVAKPLAELLTIVGISVWFDQFEMKLGDSLRRKIDEGLASCRYGVVLLSRSFFGKHYTNRELDGLAQREVDGEKVILPIWVGVDERQVRTFSLPLADRVAARWEDGIAEVVAKLIDVIKPGLIDVLQRKPIYLLPQLTTGQEIVDIMVGSHFSYKFNDDPKDEAEADLIGGFIQELRDWADIWDDVSVPDQLKAALHLSGMIAEMELAGWSIYGRRMRGKGKFAGIEDEWVWCVIAVLRGTPKEVVFTDGRISVFRPDQ